MMNRAQLLLLSVALAAGCTKDSDVTLPEQDIARPENDE